MLTGHTAHCFRNEVAKIGLSVDSLRTSGLRKVNFLHLSNGTVACTDWISVAGIVAISIKYASPWGNGVYGEFTEILQLTTLRSNLSNGQVSWMNRKEFSRCDPKNLISIHEMLVQKGILFLTGPLRLAC